MRRAPAAALVLVPLLVSACAIRPRVDPFVLEDVQREEAELLKRVVVYDDPVLLDYLGQLGRRLASYPPRPRHLIAGAPMAGTASGQTNVAHHELTFHVVRDPTLALFATPNAVFIHTGLLAATDNEAQLAAVLGHEMAHMLDHHERYAAEPPPVRPRLDGQGLASRTASAIFALGFPVTGRAALTGYGRRERAADVQGLMSMQHAGWDPREGPAAYRRLAEWSQEAGPREVFLFGNRRWLSAREESTRWCLHKLMTRGLALHGARSSQDFERVLRPVVRENAHEDLRQGHFTLARRQLDRVAVVTPDDPRLHFYYGELHRLQAQRAANDAERDVGLIQARAAYERALALDAGLADAHRQLGFLYYAMRDLRRARVELERYLTLAPGAADRARVAEYLVELSP